MKWNTSVVGGNSLYFILTLLAWFLKVLGRKSSRGHCTADPGFYDSFSRQRHLRCGCLRVLVSRVVKYGQLSLKPMWSKLCCQLAPNIVSASFPSISSLLFLHLVAKQGLVWKEHEKQNDALVLSENEPFMYSFLYAQFLWPKSYQASLFSAGIWHFPCLSRTLCFLCILVPGFRWSFDSKRIALLNRCFLLFMILYDALRFPQRWSRVSAPCRWSAGLSCWRNPSPKLSTRQGQPHPGS